MKFESLYCIEQTVYVKTDIDQRPRMIVGVFFMPNNAVKYDLSPGGWYWEIELSETKDVLLSSTN